MSTSHLILKEDNVLGLNGAFNKSKTKTDALVLNDAHAFLSFFVCFQILIRVLIYTYTKINNKVTH